VTGHTQRAHALLSPSGADRWIACPGSALACADLPRSDSAASIEGTRRHELLEVAWATCSVAREWVGEKLAAGVVTEDDAIAVQVVLDYYQSLHDHGWRLQIEKRVSETGVHPECWGTPDAVGFVEKHAVHVVDAKFGRKPVEPTSTQLVIYGALMAINNNVPLICTIVQPTTTPPIRTHVWPVSALRIILDGLRGSAIMAMQPHAPRNAGPWCEYCGVKDTCPALQARALQVAQSDFTPTGAKVPPAPATLTPDQLGQILTHADTIEAWLAGVRARAMQIAQQGDPPPGWKLVQGRAGNRKWADDAAAILAIEAAGLDAYERSVISPAVAEKTAGKALFRDHLAALTTRSDGKPELVPVGDKRPAISGPQEDFKP